MFLLVMGKTVTDISGRTREALIATLSLTVRDPLYGFNRKIHAGSQVPVHMEAAYREATGKKA
jgi:hypothetical protein